ncbi:MAG: hypothetical protein RMK84_12335 [Oscillochloridaceae bacterium]|nr:hypothetical protein [Chloroflexaceae bacterium]MDW8390907.1 hypothetical protein [Oscillochloridaceae bacterium]
MAGIDYRQSVVAACGINVQIADPPGTAALYARVLWLPGHHVRTAGFWLIAQMAIVINVAFPAGLVAMGAFLLHVFRRTDGWAESPGLPCGAARAERLRNQCARRT